MYLFSSNYISSCFRHSSCRINATADKRGTFILEMIPLNSPTGHGWAFCNCRERLEKFSQIITNRHGFLLVFVQFVLHSAYSQLIRDRFFNLFIGYCGFGAQLISPIQLHVKRQNSSICKFFQDIAWTFFCL